MNRQTKVTMEIICFNYTKTAAGATSSPRFLRTMAKTVNKGNLYAVRETVQEVMGESTHNGTCAEPGKRRVKRTLGR